MSVKTSFDRGSFANPLSTFYAIPHIFTHLSKRSSDKEAMPIPKHFLSVCNKCETHETSSDRGSYVNPLLFFTQCHIFARFVKTSSDREAMPINFLLISAFFAQF